MVVTLAAFVLTAALGDWWPDRTVVPLLSLAFGRRDHRRAVARGLDRARRDGERDRRLHAVRRRADRRPARARSPRRSAPTASRTSPTSPRWALPFEALYQAGLADLTADTVGFTRLAIDLGPFGGAQSAGAGLWLYSLAYLVVVGAVAAAAFGRRDL